MFDNSLSTTYATDSKKNHPDNENLQALRQGDVQALDNLYRTHRNAFLKWAEKHFGLDYHQAVDVYQDVIITFYENVQTGRLTLLQASLKTYLFAIGKNLILTMLRHQRREQESWQGWEQTQSESDHSIPLHSPADWQQELLDAVSSSIPLLPERGQALIHLFYFEKLPLKQISTLLGYKNEDVAKSTKLRYLSTLRREVQRQVIQQSA